MSAIVPFVWTTPESLLIVALMIVIGGFGSVGHYFLIAAHRQAPASLISPFMYTQLVWAVILGYLIFSDVPTVWTLAGAGIVIASGLYLFNRERKAHSKRRSIDGIDGGPAARPRPRVHCCERSAPCPTTKLDVLMIGPVKPYLVEGLGAAFKLHVLATAKDREALIDELGAAAARDRLLGAAFAGPRGPDAAAAEA